MTTPSEISAALDVLAQLIDRDGPKYLPLYERLEAEYCAAISRADAMSRATARARALRSSDGSSRPPRAPAGAGS